MHRMTWMLAAVALGVVGSARSASGQQVGAPVFRDVSAVQRLRVVCSNRHFGRVEDFVVDVVTGRLVDAVVKMGDGPAAHAVAVPFPALTYDAQAHLLRMAACPADGREYPPFDAASVRVAADDDGGDDAGRGGLHGQVLLGHLATGPVALADDALGSVQGATLELTRGCVAFLHVAVGREPAGDRELRPVPWAAVRYVMVREEAGDPAVTVPVPGLAMTAAALSDKPDLAEIILADPLYRARLYPLYAVPTPDYESGQ